MSLPLRLPWEMAQTRWAQELNEFIDNPSNNVSILKNIQLISGDNTINHLLGRNLQGWRVIRYQDSWAQLYDKQNANASPNLTLVLNASADVLIDLEVF